MQREITLITGQAGSGKTTVANLIVQDELRTIILDAGFDEFKAQPVNTIDELIAHVEQRNENGCGFFRVSYTPTPAEYETVFDLAMAVNKDNEGQIVNTSLLVVEEASCLGEPERGSMYEYALVKGRHEGLSMMAVTLFPSQLSITLRSQATRLILFRQTEPAHLKYIEGKVGRDIARLLPTLENFEFIDWSAQGGWGRRRIQRAGEKFLLTPLT